MSGDLTFSFGRQLKRHRRQAGLTQERLAELAGVGLRTLSDIENGATTYPQAETAERLLAALRLPPAEHEALLALLRTSPRRRGASAAATRHPGRGEQPVLPAPLTPIVGRDLEITALMQLLRQARDGTATRLLTLSGPGGVGKTRLALEVGSRLRGAFADGLALVELDSLADPALVISAIARKLGLRESGRQPLQETLRLHLSSKELLLILDNFEQVAPAAPRVVELLAACPRVTALVTSRAALRVRGEQVVELRPLELPDARQADARTVSQCAAVDLFVQRARAVVPRFTLDATNAPAVAALCRRLDGLPLAIELAAPWVNVLPPTTLLARLDRAHPPAPTGADRVLELLVDGALDLPERQRTLRATIAWSYDLLSAREQELFRRVSVFVGGCTVEAAVAVCGAVAASGAAPVREGDMLAGAAALAGQSLVRLEAISDGADHHATRVGMLRTIQEFGLECLTAAGELPTLRRSHALYYLAYAEQAEAQLTGPQQDVWLERLAREDDNLRAALHWTLESNELEIGLRLAGSLWRFWYMSGRLSDGRGWLDRLLQQDGSATVAAAPRAKALNGAGVLAHFQGDYARAGALHEESLSLRRRLGNKVDIAGSLNNLALVARQQGDYPRAAALFEQSLALRRELNESWGLSTALGNLASVALDLGDHGRAAALYAESLTLSRARGDMWSSANTLAGLALVADYQGDYARMAALSEEGVALARRLGDTSSVAYALANLALARHRRGEDTDAMALYRESLELHWSMGDKVGIATCLDGLADIACALGRHEQAARLLGTTAALRAAIGSPVRPSAQADHQRCVAAVRAALGAEACAAAWAAGAAQALDQVLADYTRHDP